MVKSHTSLQGPLDDQHLYQERPGATSVGIFSRCFRALLIGAVMYFSLRSRGVPISQSVAVTLIPLLLGVLDLLTAFAYSLSGVVLILPAGTTFWRGIISIPM